MSTRLSQTEHLFLRVAFSSNVTTLLRYAAVAPFIPGLQITPCYDDRKDIAVLRLCLESDAVREAALIAWAQVAGFVAVDLANMGPEQRSDLIASISRYRYAQQPSNAEQQIALLTQRILSAGVRTPPAKPNSAAHRPPNVRILWLRDCLSDLWTPRADRPQQRRLARGTSLSGISGESAVDTVEFEAAFDALRKTVDGAVSRLVQEVSTTTAAVPSAGHLAGMLSRIKLTALLSMIDIERITGEVSLWQGTRECTLYCRSGKLVDAEMIGEDFAPRDVVSQLMGWTHGRFELALCDVDQEDRVEVSTTALLLDLAREEDERNIVGDDDDTEPIERSLLAPAVP